MLKIGNSDISQAFLGNINIIAAYLGEIQIFGSETSQYLTFEAAADNCQIKFYAVDSSNTKTILVSTDKNTWTSKTSSTDGTVLATLNSGLKLYVKGSNSAYSNSSGYSNSILPTANCYVYGNVMSLIDDSNFKTLTTISTSCAFRDLFNSSIYSSSTNSLFILKKSGKNIVLPATTLADSCYYSMFMGCSSLTSAPELPATTLTNSCYHDMFNGCSSLTSAPELPATTLTDSCYYSMFMGCSSLTSAPKLPATTLASNCYHNMFANCSSLTSAPELPATTLTNNCYYGMFMGCSSLGYIKCLATTGINENNSTKTWISGVASTGTFIKDANATWPTGVNGIPTGWTVFNANALLFKSIGNSTIELLSKSSDHTLEYSLDNITWTNMTPSTNIQLADNQIVSIRGILSGNLSTNNYTQFKMSGSIEALGNCNALWNYNNLNASLKQYCGYNLFYGCSSLTSAPELPATTLADNCYSNMFYSCSSLTSAPELPATTLINSCYSSMFMGCSSLTSAPELPATTLVSSCYSHMFYNCSSLTSAPVLPATTLVSWCYYNMFRNCSKLSYIKCLATTGINENGSTTYWVYNVASTGTFIKDANATWPTGDDGIPSEWTIINANANFKAS